MRTDQALQGCGNGRSRQRVGRSDVVHLRGSVRAEFSEVGIRSGAEIHGLEISFELARLRQ